MILFVFEGAKDEPCIYDGVRDVCGIKDDIVCVFNAGIHSLYKDVFINDLDLFLSLSERLRAHGDSTLKDYKASDISETYLFFDYDLHDKHIPLAQLNEEIMEMLEFFNEETEHGKLYINYPMLESVKYTKELPDDNYYKYVVKRADCCNFKDIAAKFSYYNDFQFLFPRDSKGRSNKYLNENWEHIRKQNLCKANFVCNGIYEMPTCKEVISQANIFQSQLDKYLIPNDEVSILNSFPMFIFEYLK